MPWFDPRPNRKSKSKTGTFSLRTRDRRVPGLQNSNRGSFRVSGQKNYRILHSGVCLCATGDLQIRWKLLFLSFNLKGFSVYLSKFSRGNANGSVIFFKID